MFVQIIEGRVADPAALRRQMQRWVAELRPQAVGFLGSTNGITPDGVAFLVARFESAEAAQANSNRPEQGAWWAGTETCFAGPVAFWETTDVDLLQGGGSDAAGFVQVMKGSASDRAVIAELDAVFSAHAPTWRPDVIGGLRAWTSPTDYVEVMYFTSEAEARANEQRDPPAEVADHFDAYQAVMSDVTYFDLPEPVLVPG